MIIHYLLFISSRHFCALGTRNHKIKKSVAIKNVANIMRKIFSFWTKTENISGTTAGKAAKYNLLEIWANIGYQYVTDREGCCLWDCRQTCRLNIASFICNHIFCRDVSVQRQIRNINTFGVKGANIIQYAFSPVAWHCAAEWFEVHEPRLENGLCHLL